MTIAGAPEPRYGSKAAGAVRPCARTRNLRPATSTDRFCPSCHQKRMLAYGEWLEQNLLTPVPHRQYVFALPKLIRPFFRYRCRHLGELCRLGAGLLRTGFKAMDPRGQPAFILYVQTVGDLVTFNPHIHAPSLANFISFLTFLIVHSDWKENLPLRKVRRIRKAVIDRERARALCAIEPHSCHPHSSRPAPTDSATDRRSHKAAYTHVPYPKLRSAWRQHPCLLRGHGPYRVDGNCYDVDHGIRRSQA